MTEKKKISDILQLGFFYVKSEERKAKNNSVLFSVPHFKKCFEKNYFVSFFSKIGERKDFLTWHFPKLRLKKLLRGKE